VGRTLTLLTLLTSLTLFFAKRFAGFKLSGYQVCQVIRCCARAFVRSETRRTKTFERPELKPGVARRLESSEHFVVVVATDLKDPRFK
jgi:hypothetical protein